MNCTRYLLQNSGQMSSTRHVLRHLLSTSQYRTMVMLHPRICQRINSSCRYTGNIPLKVQLPLTWSACNYAKKAGKGEKGRQSKMCKVHITQEAIGDVMNLEDVERRMGGVVQKFQQDLTEKLNPRISLATLGKIVVDTKEGKFNLNELGQVVQKNPQTYMIDLVTSPQHVKQVRKAIDSSGLNFNLQVEGSTIYIPIPKLTRQLREDLSKNAKTLFHETNTKLSAIYGENSKKALDSKVRLSADLKRNLSNMILDLKRTYEYQAEELLEKKQKELLNET